jgi:TPP-dependent pyruvate/acetoin dehydrogenase alpha subunit
MMDDEQLARALREMLRIRLFEDRVRREFGKGDMPGFVHTYVGAEAVAVGVCSQLGDKDLITSTHRGHGHCLAKGVPIAPIVAELYGRETGLCKGRGGSMHVADFSKGMLGANAIVGGGISLAVGGALAAQTLGDGRVAVTLFGDGASNQGIFHESLNLAAIWRLPVVFVCENNQYAVTTNFRTTVATENIADRAAGYDMPGVLVDGQDVVAVYEAVREAVARARAGQGPSLVEARTYRYHDHSEGLNRVVRDPYRSEAEIEEWKGRDPISIHEDRLISQGIASEDEVRGLEAECLGAIEEALRFAHESPYPDPEEIFDDVYSNPIAIERT